MKSTLLFKVMRFMINLLGRLISRVDAEGMQNMPSTGSYIVAANHLGRLDVPLVYFLLQRDDIVILVAEKYRKYAIVRWLVEALGAIWLDRFNADYHALRETLQRLKAGGVLVIAPEGTRSTTGGLLIGKPGVSYLASKTGLPVIPVAVTGTEDKLVLARFKRLKRAHVRVKVGQPFFLQSTRGKDREAILARNTDEIMCRIAALLPESYRGVYADHPRLRELA
jgi:1-acyl-sn-glycerol-3-phosphate acyltransferase